LNKKFSLSLITAVILAAFLNFQPQKVAKAQSNVFNLKQQDQALCLPYNEDAGCLLAGPAAKLNELSSIGITFPPQPLPVKSPSADLANIPFAYARVSNEAIPLYATLEDAQNNVSNSKLEASKIKYVSLIQKATTPNGVFYLTASDEWISADYITKVGIQNFQGFLFNENPTLPFGWILSSEVKVYEGPGYEYPQTGKQYYRYNVVRTYDSKTVNDIEWVMIGQNEWIEHRFIARVLPNLTPPDKVTSDRWIEINLYEQTLLIYEKGKVVFATLISSGVHPFYTQPGVFQIYQKLENDPMSGTFEADHSDYYYLEDVPYIMYYDQKRALHGAYWNTLFGYQRSHGCVNLSVADAHLLYDWANVGDFVYVWDPSGKTPTDPSVYGAGGF
jgi:hypothetical protein